MRSPFDLLEPAGDETAVIVEVPHAGLELEPHHLEPLAAPARALARDADLYVDALYRDAPAAGASMLVSRVSRYVVDVNRAETDIDEEVAEGVDSGLRMHHGLVWRTTADGEPALMRKLTRAELQERIDLIWLPYHRALADLIRRKRERFGLAILLAAHSMPSAERPHTRNAISATNEAAGGRDPRSVRPRADVVPGTRGRRSADARFIDMVEAHAVSQGWSVRHDDPYAGGYTTQHYGRPADRVHVVQLELARRLYLDEATLRPGVGFDAVQAWCRELVAKLGAVGAAIGAAAASGRASA